MTAKENAPEIRRLRICIESVQHEIDIQQEHINAANRTVAAAILKREELELILANRIIRREQLKSDLADLG